MKFKNYINESNIDNKIEEMRKDCGKLIDLMKIHKVMFQRYMDEISPTGIIGKRKTRKNRKPRDTRDSNHEISNAWFKEKFGWKARSDHVLFANMVKIKNVMNGNLVFPVKPEKFIWSPIIEDMTIDLNSHDVLSLNLFDYKKSILIDALEKANYMDLKPGKLFFMVNMNNSGHEIMIKCKEYWYVNLYGIEYKKGLLKRIGLI